MIIDLRAFVTVPIPFEPCLLSSLQPDYKFQTTQAAAINRSQGKNWGSKERERKRKKVEGAEKVKEQTHKTYRSIARRRNRRCSFSRQQRVVAVEIDGVEPLSGALRAYAGTSQREARSIDHEEAAYDRG